MYQYVNINLRYWQGRVPYWRLHAKNHCFAQIVDKTQFLTIVGLRSPFPAGSQLRALIGF